MAPGKQPRGPRRREPTKAELAADNARLRRALARQTRRAVALERKQAADTGDSRKPTVAREAAR